MILKYYHENFHSNDDDDDYKKTKLFIFFFQLLMLLEIRIKHIEFIKARWSTVLLKHLQHFIKFLWL